MKKRFGPTGKFPEGKINADDEGELALGVAYDPRTGAVMIKFGIPVEWIALPPDKAIELANIIIVCAKKAEQ